MVVIIDYGMGNLRSVEKAVESLGVKAKVTDSISLIKSAKKIIFPGVGHFDKAVKELKKRKIYQLLKERINGGVPFLGICLGMQLLLETSEEASGVKGLGIIKGKVKKFSGKLIVPHMGWNQVRVTSNKLRVTSNKLFKGVPNGTSFYFAHSYYCAPKEDVALTVTDYGKEFVSSLNKGNVWAVQFHPEKSQTLGLKVLSNFLKLCK